MRTEFYGPTLVTMLLQPNFMGLVCKQNILLFDLIIWKQTGLPRRSHQSCSIKKDVLKKFTKFTGKHLCQRLWHRCFSMNFTKFLTTLFLQSTSGRLLLSTAGISTFCYVHWNTIAAHTIFTERSP